MFCLMQPTLRIVIDFKQPIPFAMVKNVHTQKKTDVHFYAQILQSFSLRESFISDPIRETKERLGNRSRPLSSPSV